MSRILKRSPRVGNKKECILEYDDHFKVWRVTIYNENGTSQTEKVAYIVNACYIWSNDVEHLKANL